ncbi:MAG TPA: short chain dehydrogenase [Dinghuibacter sp.]|uniref:short chain dehydrogenase n=1 Tax=Dinghuibacter sp. TaxID=2024697 RepID=UPI002C82AA65|nr:short chain dehydrogenase [Dinghuibacter sp.]HTJ13025.1 short chain dehydrogenase [Dinghuibacter sp.]
MKIIIVGASGTLGKRITAYFEKDHEVVRVGSKSGDVQANITDSASIEAMYKKVGPFDALICAAGEGHFGPLDEMTGAHFRIGLESKLLGQVNLVLIGQHYVRPKGSFTLTGGILADDPVPMGANLSAVNGGLEAFARAAAIELASGVRVNVISPGVVEDSPGYFPYFPGHTPVAMDRLVQAYAKSVLGRRTGEVIKVY